MHDIHTVHFFHLKKSDHSIPKVELNSKVIYFWSQGILYMKKRKSFSHVMHQCSHFYNVFIILQVDKTFFHFLVYFSCSAFVFPVGLAVLK